MEWVRKGLSWARRSPPSGPRDGDIIYPLHFLDNEPNLRKPVVTWTMRFNDVLDHEMLHASLVKLLETGDWRKLGGRLAERDNKFYIYSPPSYTPERPAVNYSHEEFDIEIHEHPVGKLMPGDVSGQPSLHPNYRTFFEAFAVPSGAPQTVEDYLSQDIPVLSLHVVRFKNATLASVTWPHAIMDAMSLRDLMEAWTIALSGRDSEIPPLLGAKEDVADKFSEKVYGRKNFALQSLRLTGLKFFLFVVHFMCDVFFGPRMEPFLVTLPKSAVEGLRKEVEAELGSLAIEREDKDDDRPGEVQERISRGDILFAWFIHLVVSAMPKPRPIGSIASINLRKRLPGVIEPGSSALYIQNIVLMTTMSMSAARAAAASMGEIARQLRRSLIAQGTADQLIAYLQTLQRETKDTGRYPSIIACEPNSLLITNTNWTITDLCRAVDFSPAVIRAGDTSSSRRNPPGSLLYHYSSILRTHFFVRNTLGILGTDHEGTYWLAGWVDAGTVSKMEESIRRLSS